MPTVGRKKFDYTKKGVMAAKKEAAKTGEPMTKHKMPMAPKKGFAVVKPMSAKKKMKGH